MASSVKQWEKSSGVQSIFGQNVAFHKWLNSQTPVLARNVIMDRLWKHLINYDVVTAGIRDKIRVSLFNNKIIIYIKDIIFKIWGQSLEKFHLRLFKSFY